MPTPADLDALPFALRLAYAVEDAEDRGPLRTLFQLVRLYWRLDADVARLRREGDPAGVLPTLDCLRVQSRQLAENALARYGHLLVDRCGDDDAPPAAPIMRVSRAVRFTVAALAAPAEAAVP